MQVTKELCRKTLADIESDPQWQSRKRGDRVQEAARRVGLKRSQFYHVVKTGPQCVRHPCRFCGNCFRMQDHPSIRSGFCRGCISARKKELNKRREWPRAIAKALRTSARKYRRFHGCKWNNWARQKSGQINRTRRSLGSPQHRSYSSFHDATLAMSVRLDIGERERKLDPWRKNARSWSRTLRTIPRNGKTMKKVTPKDLMKMLDEQGYMCAITGDPLDPSDCAVDHIKPIVNGGEHRLENLQVVTSAANKAKHTLDMSEFIELCRKVVELHDGKPVAAK